MNMDANLRAEVISSLFGQTVALYQPQNGFAAGAPYGRNLSLDEFHMSTILGNPNPYQELFFDGTAYFDPEFDCDFTRLHFLPVGWRGDEAYRRPLGWYRMALKVKGKYPDGDTWLGPEGWRNHSVAGEWPVSYHGTSLDGAKGIIREHFKAGERAVHGRGIYSTPDLHVAEREEYAKTFLSQTTGKTYKVIMQNRINPSWREICSKQQNYWLIRVNAGTSPEMERSIVECSIRPYGILIKEVNAWSCTVS